MPSLEDTETPSAAPRRSRNWTADSESFKSVGDGCRANGTSPESTATTVNKLTEHTGRRQSAPSAEPTCKCVPTLDSSAMKNNSRHRSNSVSGPTETTTSDNTATEHVVAHGRILRPVQIAPQSRVSSQSTAPPNVKVLNNHLDLSQGGGGRQNTITTAPAVSAQPHTWDSDLAIGNTNTSTSRTDSSLAIHYPNFLRKWWVLGRHAVF